MTITSALYLIFLLLLWIIFSILIKNRKNTTDFSRYSLKKYLMNRSEQNLYTALIQQLGKEYLILTKVRIEDFVEAKSYRLRNRIKSRHVDFLICKISDTSPLLAIELDGNSHNNPEIKSRDLFVNNLYKSIGLPIRHILVGSDFTIEIDQIKKQLCQL